MPKGVSFSAFDKMSKHYLKICRFFPENVKIDACFMLQILAILHVFSQKQWTERSTVQFLSPQSQKSTNQFHATKWWVPVNPPKTPPFLSARPNIHDMDFYPEILHKCDTAISHQTQAEACVHSRRESGFFHVSVGVCMEAIMKNNSWVVLDE